MRYILSNLLFFSTVAILVLVLGIISLTPITAAESKYYLISNFSFCAILCVLTLICDFIFFAKPIAEKAANFTAALGLVWGTFVLITSYIWAILAFTGMFMFLGSIPFCGKVLQLFVWCVLTIPIRIYYLVTRMMPVPQDIFNLLSVKLYTTIDTLSSFLTPANIILACLPNVIVIIVMTLTTKYFIKESSYIAKTLTCIIGFLIFAAYCIESKGGSILRDSVGCSVYTIRCTLLSPNMFAMNITKLHLSRKDFTADNLQEQPHDNIVIILDESMRGDYLSINNPEANTTPELARYINTYHDNIFNYGLMMSTSTTSSSSRITLMTDLTKLPDIELEEFKRPTIFDIAKANNYKTILINIQGDLPDMVFRASDMSKADEVYLSGSDFEDVTGDADMNAAAFLHKRLSEEKGLFVFIEKQGLHIPYQNRYPLNDSAWNVFTPCLEPVEWYSALKRREIINSYKNAVHYNIDGFFAQLFGNDPISLKDCTILYTSDHGQSFMEYGQLESHGTTYLEQAIVPFLIFSTDSWVLARLKRPYEIPYTLHHMNITPTLHAIMCRDDEYDTGIYSSLVSSGDFRKPELRYIMRGSPVDCELSPEVPSDNDGKIILPLDKYMY